MIHPATPIFTPRLVLRCWSPQDAPLLKDALDSSLDHLRPWMPWALDEPSPLPAIEDRLTRFAANFRDGRDFIYGIFNHDETAVLGGTGLHPRNGPQDLEIGYWLRESAIGQGFISEAVSALTTVAFAMRSLETVTIVCDPLNRPSAAVASRLGFSCLGSFPAKTPGPGRESDQIWQTSRPRWAARPARRIPARVS